jgi:hypothetical protein
LKGWNLNIEGEYRKNRGNVDHRDEIDNKGELYGLSKEDRVTKNAIQDQQRMIIKEEEIKWIQRAKEKRTA